MNWDDLRFFLAVGRSESLTGAARLLRTDPATVGRRIARLEEAMDTALFSRSPQGYALTDAGERLLEYAVQAETSLAAGAAEIAGQGAAGLSGQIRIGAPDGVANYLLPQVCAAIAEENPDLEIQIVALPRLFNLSRREADMAITVSAPSAGRLTVQKISDYRLHLAATRAYLSRHPQIRALEDLKTHRIVGYIPDMIFDKELDYLNEIGAERVPLASNSVAVQFQWIAQGLGLGIIHDFALAHQPTLQRILPEEFSLTRGLYLVRHADDSRLDRNNRFAALLAGQLRAEIARLEAFS
ncbi:LysR family transcriptional regulator [Pseudooceanicola sp. HF7]|uniref:LysR family transcriptional regulator n=1 Tax=Pseudooceanicola sp. HF7 TaxID=2721560 RepID=UPI0014304DED|nr:LysR family transcriptional regulator [Pseudooceanicola sp. HF7]NIZ11583.1 LysR family transcriptional regulator [Pseudooceanicola sp. HF7]